MKHEDGVNFAMALPTSDGEGMGMAVKNSDVTQIKIHDKLQIMGGKNADGMDKLSLTHKETLVLEKLFCTACVILFPSISLYFSIIRVSDITPPPKYMFAFLTLLIFDIFAVALFALLLSLSIDNFKNHKHLAYGLSTAATGSYVFLVATFGLFGLVGTFVTISTVMDVVSSVSLVILFLVFCIHVATLIMRVKNDEMFGVKLVRVTTIVAFSTYAVGLLLQCAFGMVTFRTAVIHAPIIVILIQKYYSGHLLF